ncbi:MAG TPA: efflux RND transporter periplasmic adaptor subunit [Rhabdochlamydiaceae bacterium]|nr:efflux RND transporter periplasmic adaptor subunit [Rhabdochlamydiaceae bacterium]
MKRIFIGTLFFILFIALIIAAIHLYRRSKENPHELVLYGNVDVRLVDIGFRVAGLVEKLNYEEGDVVPKGALMAVLDKTPYTSQIEQAAANAEAIQPNLTNAEIHLKRRKELIGIGGVSQEDLDNAQASRDQLQANLDAATSALAVAMDNLAYTQAYAPTDGIILTRIREPGTVVNPSDPVYTLSVTSPVWIRAYVDEPHLGQIYYGMECTIYTDTKGGPTYSGKIGFISPVAEFTPKTVETTELRTDLVYRLRIYADNPDKYLKQGMPVTVKMHLRNQSKEEK